MTLPPVDLPDQDPELVAQPYDVLRDLATEAANNLRFLCSGILGYQDLTEQCHGALCTFVDTNPALLKLILMPRDHFKTTVVTIGGTIQKVIRNPDNTNLICNESSTNAERMLRAIRVHAESNRKFRTIFSQLIPKDTRSVRWNDHELDFNRQDIRPEPSIDTVGMSSAMTSRHYHHITFDDPISEEAAGSDSVMRSAIERVKAQQALLVRPAEDSITYVGTRWAFRDIYTWLTKTYPARLRKFIRAAIEDDKILFPERFTPEILAELREAMGDYKFASLMMNNPRDEKVQDFNLRDVRWWRWADVDETAIELLDREGVVVDRWSLDRLDITLALDPAPAEFLHSDRNAIVVTGVTPKAQVVVLHTWAERCNPHEVLKHLLWCKRRWNPRVFGVEGVAYQKTFKYFLMQYGLDHGEYFHIYEVKSQGAKHKTRQIRSLQPVAAVGRLYLHPTQHILRNELSDFPLGEHDDVLDATAMNSQLWLGQMAPEAVERATKLRESLTRRITSDGIIGDIRIKDDAHLGRYLKGQIEREDEDDEPVRYGNWEEVELGHEMRRIA